MPKFTLIADHGDGHVISHEFEEEFLDEVVQNLNSFLRGTGYYYDGELQIVEEEMDIEFNRDSWDWTVNELGKFGSQDTMATTTQASGGAPEVSTVCSVCRLPTSTMERNMCWDDRCPKESNAN